jgi:hypothetical protein
MMEGVGRRLSKKGGFLLNIGTHSLNGREHNVLFRSNGDSTFSEVAFTNAADRVEDGRGLAVLDFDNDGHLDLALRNYRGPAGLLRNLGSAGHWIRFELVGTRSNRDAVGARIRLRSGDRWQTRVVSAGSGYLSSSSLRQHFGLAGATRVEEVEIRWPSGERTILRELSADRLYRVTEGAPAAAAEIQVLPAAGSVSSQSTHQTAPDAPASSPSNSSATVPGRPSAMCSSSGSAALT